MIKALREVVMEGKNLNIIKAIYDKPQPALYLMEKT
jgi:hypothetical protein